jgi:hypothetical protein
LFLLLVFTFPVQAKEVQSHGFTFEQQVWNHMFQRGYTDDWDIPGSANLQNPGVPISVKFMEWKNSIYLGDAGRQFAVNEPFEMVVGFYQKVEGEKQIVALHHLSFTPEQWQQMWGEITAVELAAFSERIKQGSIEAAQDYARPHAAELRKKSGIFSINPKINKDQRRIQCSIPFTVFYQQVLKQEPEIQEKIILWGRELN